MPLIAPPPLGREIAAFVPELSLFIDVPSPLWSGPFLVYPSPPRWCLQPRRGHPRDRHHEDQVLDQALFEPRVHDRGVILLHGPFPDGIFADEDLPWRAIGAGAARSHDPSSRVHFCRGDGLVARRTISEGVDAEFLRKPLLPDTEKRQRLHRESLHVGREV